jgi:hypothetical protein
MRNAKLVWVIVVVLSVATSPLLGVVHFMDGGIHDIDYDVGDEVEVDSHDPGPGLYTTVNILEGGRIDFLLWSNHNSRVNMSGGWVDGTLVTGNTSQAYISGGLIQELAVLDNSQVEISGGVIAGRMQVNNQTRVEIYGGSIDGNLEVRDECRVDIYGGSIGGALILEPGPWPLPAVLTIHGSDFAINGQPVGYGNVWGLYHGPWENEPTRRLTGRLNSGELIDNDFYIGHGSKIILVPEPAAIVLLALGAVMLRRRR